MHILFITKKPNRNGGEMMPFFAIHKKRSKGHYKTNKFFKVPDLIQTKRGVKGNCLPLQQGFISHLTWSKYRQGREQDPELIDILRAPLKSKE